MDGIGAAIQTDTNEKGNPEKNVNNTPEDTIPSFSTDPKNGKDGEQKEPSQHSELSGEVNMEGAINSDDVIRAGGFGARDGISSVLPIASDSIDFESSLLDMREYEEPQGERPWPGLGWSEDKDSDFRVNIYLKEMY